MGVWGEKVPFILLAKHDLVQGGCRCENFKIPEESIDHFQVSLKIRIIFL